MKYAYNVHNFYVSTAKFLVRRLNKQHFRVMAIKAKPKKFYPILG